MGNVRLAAGVAFGCLIRCSGVGIPAKVQAYDPAWESKVEMPAKVQENLIQTLLEAMVEIKACTFAGFYRL